MNFTIASTLRWWSRDQGDALALSVDDRLLSFRELYDWSGRIGARLIELGVRPEDRICVVAMNSMEYAILAMGMMRIGAIAAPLNFRSTVSELRDWRADLTPMLFFADADRRATVAEALGNDAAGNLFALEELNQYRSGPASELSYLPADDAPVFIIGTSGSTARPKGVIYSHRSILSFACEFVITEPRCGRGSRILSVGPFSSSSGYLLLMGFIALGVTMFIESQFRAERALRLLVEKRITTIKGAPIFFERIAALPEFADADLSALYWAQVGGARVPTSLLKAWRDKGVVLRQLYGSTEAGGGWAARDDSAVSAPEKCGRGGLFTQYRILGEDGGAAPVGVAGEILVRSACMMEGYWNNPTASAEAIVDGWLHSGDLGLLDATENLIFVDRLKDIIISGGLNISAAEVERVIGEIPGVLEVAVIAADDVQFGETPLAIVYGNVASLSPALIIERCNAALANYKVPRYVDIVSAPLPRLPSGKISKPELRRRYKDAASRLPKVR